MLVFLLFGTATKTYLLYGGVGEIFFSHRRYRAEKLDSLCAKVGKKVLLFET